MFVLVIVLNKSDYLSDILAAFVRLGVRGATIVDSRGMASAIKYGQGESIPLFGSLTTLFAGAQPFNNTIFTVINGQELLDQTVKAIQEIMNEVKRPGAGFVFTVPVANMYLLGTKDKQEASKL